MKLQKGEGDVPHSGQGWTTDSWVTSAVAFHSGVLKGQCFRDVFPDCDRCTALTDPVHGSVRGHCKLTQHLRLRESSRE